LIGQNYSAPLKKEELWVPLSSLIKRQDVVALQLLSSAKDDGTNLQYILEYVQVPYTRTLTHTPSAIANLLIEDSMVFLPNAKTKCNYICMTTSRSCRCGRNVPVIGSKSSLDPRRSQASSHFLHD
jgi:hypothetical protein